MTGIIGKPGESNLLSGNEAIARGALEAGICFSASYPGTPSTEITASLIQVAEQHGLYVEWSVNEKVALEACAGASWAGIPSLCAMKSLGLNVAADFLLNVNLSGTGPGGLVIVVCDDPRGHSSSNEQDSRFYAKAAYLPLLEPSTCQQAKDIIPIALDISKRFQIPVIVRSTTRLSHSRSIVELAEIPKRSCTANKELADTLFNVPNPHLRHKELNEKISKIHREFEESDLNGHLKGKNANTLIIASGVSSKYAEEAVALLGLNNVHVANLVTSYPLPQKRIMDWLQDKKRVLFTEEVDPFIEEEVLALAGEYEWGEKFAFYGKRNGYIPSFGELNTDEVKKALLKMDGKDLHIPDATKKAADTAKSILIPRPLTFCAGCTHRNVYWALQKVKQRLKGDLVVAGDIGCYSLGVFYGESMNTMQAMGSGIGTTSGLGQLSRFGFEKKVVAVAGDSTFFHACLPGLVNAKHKSADVTLLILDNSTTAMTGFQPHPGSRPQTKDEDKISIEAMVRSIEPDFYQMADASDPGKLIDLIHKTVEKKGLKVLLLNSVCRLDEARLGETYENLVEVTIDSDTCRGESCRICTDKFGCIALTWDNEKQKPEILNHVCVRCRACIAVCPHDAIQRGEP